LWRHEDSTKYCGSVKSEIEIFANGFECATAQQSFMLFTLAFLSYESFPVFPEENCFVDVDGDDVVWK
jgi:hypothetical protein